MSRSVHSLLIRRISQGLISLQKYIVEFARKCRSLDEMDRWKVTEFRQFLLYSGPVALKGVLCEQLHKHFLLLFVAIYCLVSPGFCVSHCQYAHELLCLFVTQAGQLYGRDVLVYNVHGLIHLAADVRNFGPLDSYSAFPFENFLGKVEKTSPQTKFSSAASNSQIVRETRNQINK